MSKKIHTIQSFDKIEFEKEVNFFLELGCELLEGSYELINKNKNNIYSQVIIYYGDLEFYKNGGIKSFYSRNKKGDRHGKWISWYNNGQKEYQKLFSQDKHINESFWWNNDGKLQRKREYLNNKPKNMASNVFEHFVESKYHKNEKLSSEEYYFIEKLGGKKILHGRSRTFYKNGRIKEEVYFIRGENDPNETLTSWWVTGKKKRFMEKKDGRLHGAFILWHPDGKVKEEIFYNSGKKVGKQIINYKNNGENVFMEKIWNEDEQLLSWITKTNNIKTYHLTRTTLMELKIVHPWGNHPYWSFDIKEERWYNSGKKKCKKEMNLDLLPIECEYHGYSSLRTVYPFIDSNLWDIIFWDNNENKYNGIYREWDELGWDYDRFKDGKYIIFNDDFKKNHPVIPLKKGGYANGEIKDGEPSGNWIFFDNNGKITKKKTY